MPQCHQLFTGMACVFFCEALLFNTLNTLGGKLPLEFWQHDKFKRRSVGCNQKVQREAASLLTISPSYTPFFLF